MEEKTIDVYGRIERIVSREFINGQLFSTRFAMSLEAPPKIEGKDPAIEFDFYGDIPQDFVGQQARYLRQSIEVEDLSRVTADITLGEIQKGERGYYLVDANVTNPRIPTRITSQLLKRVKGIVIFPYEHLNR